MTNARADSETRANVVVGFKKQTAVKTRKSVSADETEHEGRKQAGNRQAGSGGSNTRAWKATK